MQGYPIIQTAKEKRTKKPILITGASGVLGRTIVSAFIEAGLSVRQAVRHLEKAKVGIGSTRLDYSDPETFSTALDGIGGLLLMAPPLDSNAPAKLEPMIGRAKARVPATGTRNNLVDPEWGIVIADAILFYDNPTESL